MPQSLNGILLLDKPINMTSNAALQRVKRLFCAKKAGHTGSLDPIATGMLPLCFGEATKFSQFLLEADKTYRTSVKMGMQTSTGDCEGVVIKSEVVPPLNATKIEMVMQQFLGMTEQIPPMYSAIKYQGKPLYQLARQGIEIPRQSRSIHITAITLEEFFGDEFSFSVRCSKGTYVRTLAEDICKKLECCGHVIALRRLAVSPFDHAMMHTLSALESKLEELGQEELMRTSILPIETAISILPKVKLSASSVFYLRTGQSVRVSTPLKEGSFVQLLSEMGQFVGIGSITNDSRVRPYRLMAV